MQSGAFKTSTVPNDRVFEAMGSFRNRGILLIADSQINLIKARVPRSPFTSCMVLIAYRPDLVGTQYFPGTSGQYAVGQCRPF